MELLTNSRSQSFKVCRKRNWYAYELGLRPVTEPKALRIGTAIHLGLDALSQGTDIDDAIATACQEYDSIPMADLEWQYERATVAALLSGYAWRWAASKLKVLATEQSFELPLQNPATNKPSTVFALAGVIDRIVRLEDNRFAVMESKTASEDLALGSDYWLRLQNDLQISIYVHAARALGCDVATVLYDVIRKPTIKPTVVPLLDDDGLKIVLDADGQRVLKKDGKPRQTGDTAKGYVLQTRPMTPDEWTQKIIDGIAARPEWYYARVEIPRLDSEIEECRAELWDIQKTLREAQRTCRWYRTVTRDTCGFCSYFGLCSSKTDVSSGEAPENFEFVSNVHPELKGISDE